VLFADAAAVHSPNADYLPGWNTANASGVIPGVAIDRVTRTAADAHLFQREVVPAGTTFSVSLSATNLEPDELELLLRGLTGVDGSHASVVGANANSGYGCVRWRPDAIKRMLPEDVSAWIASGATEMAADAARPVDAAESDRLWASRSTDLHARVTTTPVSLSLQLDTRGPFLVNDPTRTGKDPKPSHAFRRDAQGRAILPASSFRGAFRSQAERIARTIAGRIDAACQPGNRAHACKTVHELSDLNDVCFVCWAFGASGWASPLLVTDFVTDADDGEHAGQAVTLQGVAIDRFTGGAAPGKKFKSEAVRGIRLMGTLGLDTVRLETSAQKTRWKHDAVPAALGLLLLTLRDMKEGDIRFGFGSSKGYGEFSGSVTAASIPQELNALQHFLTNQLTPEDQLPIMGWVASLQRALAIGKGTDKEAHDGVS